MVLNFRGLQTFFSILYGCLFQQWIGYFFFFQEFLYHLNCTALVKDITSLFLVSTGTNFRNRYLSVLFKNTRKLCHSLQEHFNSHYSDLWKTVKNNFKSFNTFVLKWTGITRAFGAQFPTPSFCYFFFILLKGSIRKHLNGGGADRLKTLIETPFPQCLPHKAAEFKDFNSL